jgi:hypothetical protein
VQVDSAIFKLVGVWRRLAESGFAEMSVSDQIRSGQSGRY